MYLLQVRFRRWSPSCVLGWCIPKHTHTIITNYNIYICILKKRRRKTKNIYIYIYTHTLHVQQGMVFDTFWTMGCMKKDKDRWVQNLIKSLQIYLTMCTSHWHSHHCQIPDSEYIQYTHTVLYRTKTDKNSKNTIIRKMATLVLFFWVFSCKIH